ncbi:MAG: site-2 protease family protein, partial [FCB group bacterium]|nr:site-2 protease family protein [FCB group bacterium]
HIDPIGTVVMPLIMLLMNPGFFLGWAKPVPFNPMNLKNLRRDPVLIALAGPASNLLLALAATIALRIAVTIFGVEPVVYGPVGALLSQLIFINALLLLFNLIPLPPLDGHYVLHYFLPEGGKRILDSIGPFGIIIVLIVVINTPLLSVPLEALITALGHMALWGAS